MKKLRLIYSSSLAASLAVIFITTITIAAELDPPLKAWLTNFSGHHWVSKSILSLALYFVAFFLFYSAFRKVDALKIKTGLKLLIWLTVVGVLAILFLFTGHHLGWY